ncbi:TAXI family TRAP transporter solute-binding subunit [Metabacillus idriensis]|uniref:TAXI family TRAP transporter solute-binding subunit n=1 Tax=Metabacillus idriensis TaxID=324768 RepID=UPI00174ECDCE|nr:TAXI family TRAP transporter solute-binding subunit [Metabacillus idriensis]
MKIRKSLFVVMMLVLAMIISACGEKEATTGSGGGSGDSGDSKPKTLRILTGGTGGTYYPLGGSFGDIISDKTDYKATVQSSGASVENMQTLKSGDAEIAFSQTDIATYALNGESMFKDNKIDNVLGLGTLYNETVQLITTEKSGIKSVEDLKGKKVSVGAIGSGAYLNATQVLEVHGLTVEDIQAQNLSFDESTEGIQGGSIDAAFVTAGTPTAAVETLSAQNDVVVVPLEADKVKELIEKYPFYSEDVVPSGTYKIGEDVNTVAVKAMLVVQDELAEDLVYDITKSIFENTDKIAHAKGKLIKAETALEGIGDLKLHPGAEKYFKEKGVLK